MSLMSGRLSSVLTASAMLVVVVLIMANILPWTAAADIANTGKDYNLFDLLKAEVVQLKMYLKGL